MKNLHLDTVMCAGVPGVRTFSPLCWECCGLPECFPGALNNFKTREELETMRNEKLNNVQRLAVCLGQLADHTPTVNQLARILHYNPDQLKQDIKDLESYTSEKVREDREPD